MKEAQKQKMFIECSQRHSNRMQGTVGFHNWEISTFSLEEACRRPLLQHGPSRMAQGSPVKSTQLQKFSIMTSQIKFQYLISYLLLRFHLLRLHLLHLAGEHSLGLCG